MILSIDPGLYACGAAVFNDANDLLWAGLIKNGIDAYLNGSTYHSSIWNTMVDAVAAKMRALHYIPEQLAVELPQIYVASRSKGDPNDLIVLAGLVGALTSWFQGTVFLYQPHTWKGTVPKKIMCARILKHLKPEELIKIEKAPESLWHNTVDGVGVGLHHLKRL